VIVNGLLVRRTVKALGEWRTALLGVASGTAGYLVHVFATTPALAYIALTVGALGGLTVPALQALMTGQASPEAQGELQGALATIAASTVIMGPVLFSQLFAAVTGADAPIHAPGIPFLLSALLAGSALALLATGGKPPAVQD
jgi:DHA1 family tetracycline resistance protein-like MFS transporter